MASPRFCSQRARAHAHATDANAIAGTATEAAHWLLVEDPTPWGRKPLEETAWYPDVKGAIARWKQVIPDVRVQLIRRGLKTWDTPEGIRCFVIRAGRTPVVHARTIPTYNALSTLDVPRLLQEAPAASVSEAPASEGVLPDAPLVLTCTNGRRDACCAKWGRPVAQAARAAHPGGAWQSSHLGGHRFAPTTLVVPSGAHYGWLSPGDMAGLVQAHRNGRLYDLSRYRGRVSHPRPVQAACIDLRKRRSLDALNAVEGARLERPPSESPEKKSIEKKSPEEAVWRVCVHAEGQMHEAQVVRTQGDAFVHSCRASAPKPSTHFTVSWTTPVDA